MPNSDVLETRPAPGEDAEIDPLPPGVELEDFKLSVHGENAQEVADKLRASIQQSADLCSVSPPICSENLGIPRKQMPQLDSKVLPKFLASLQQKGISIEDGTEHVGQLKCTQKEMQTEKIAGMIDSIGKGTYNPADAPIIISKDGYVLDGHHRWASLLMLDPNNKMKVRKVDMPIKDLVAAANSFEGVEQAGLMAPSKMALLRRIGLAGALDFTADWFADMSPGQQKRYIQQHPGTRKKPTGGPRPSPKAPGSPGKAPGRVPSKGPALRGPSKPAPKHAPPVKGRPAPKGPAKPPVQKAPAPPKTPAKPSRRPAPHAPGPETPAPKAPKPSVPKAPTGPKAPATEPDVDLGPEGEIPGAFQTFWNALKDRAGALADTFKALPRQAQQFFADKEYRAQVGRDAATALKRKGADAVKTVVKEVKAFGTAGQAIGQLARGKPLTAQHKEALKSVAITVAKTVAGTILMGGIGNVTASALLTRFAVSTATKAVAKAALFASRLAQAGTDDGGVDRFVEFVMNGMIEQLEGLGRLTDEQLDQLLAAIPSGGDEAAQAPAAPQPAKVARLLARIAQASLLDDLRYGGRVQVRNPSTGEEFEIRSKLREGLTWYAVFQDGSKRVDYRLMSKDEASDWLSSLERVEGRVAQEAAPPSIWTVTPEKAKAIGDRLGVDWSRFDAEQFRVGIEVEYEHTSDAAEAARIALDHLRELPDYYDRLESVEREAQAGGGIPGGTAPAGGETGDTPEEQIEDAEFKVGDAVTLNETILGMRQGDTGQVVGVQGYTIGVLFPKHPQAALYLDQDLLTKEPGQDEGQGGEAGGAGAPTATMASLLRHIGYTDERGWERNSDGVREHRRVMEDKLDRPLKHSEDVHHIDEDKSNNAPSNLEVVDHGDHTSEHKSAGDATGAPIARRTVARWAASGVL